MFCYKCGARIPEDSAFCPRCGKPVPRLNGSAALSTEVYPAHPTAPTTSWAGQLSSSQSTQRAQQPRYGPNQTALNLPSIQFYETSAGTSSSDDFNSDWKEQRHDTPQRKIKEVVSSLSSRIETAVGLIPSESLKAGLIFAGIILVIIVVLIVQWPSSLSSAMNFCESHVNSEQWPNEAGESWGYFRLADSGRTLIGSGIHNYDDAIFTCILDELNAPQSVRSKIIHTRALDGTLTDSWDRIKITWNYHPRKGLDIIFEEK